MKFSFYDLVGGKCVAMKVYAAARKAIYHIIINYLYLINPVYGRFINSSNNKSMFYPFVPYANTNTEMANKQKKKGESVTVGLLVTFR